MSFQHTRQALFIRALEDLVHARPAHIRVDENNARAGLGDADGRVDRGHGFAFAGNGARDDDRTRWSRPGRQEE